MSPPLRILLIGPSGQIGRELLALLPSVGTVVTAGRVGADINLDLESANAIRDVLNSVRPDVIVNTAAYTAVDQAENDRDSAFLVNAAAPEVLAQCARACGALLIHFSTDYVFDGTASSAYTEEDETNPLSVYGQSKLAGENAVRAVADRYLILRTSWVYGLHGKNFLKTMLRLASEREELNVVNDQFGVPNWSRAIAGGTTSIIQILESDAERIDANSGTYHLSASGEATWHEFARSILESVAGRPGIVARVVNPISTEEFPTPAPRPARSTLDATKLERVFGVSLPHWRVSLERCLAD